jgi:type IV pilus assembly protein PilP
MRSIMVKIYGRIIIIMAVFLIAGVLGSVQRADASKEKMYVSSRIKIVRPAAEGSGTGNAASGASISTDVETSAAFPASEPPLASSAAPDTTGAAPVVAGTPETAANVASGQMSGESVALPSGQPGPGTPSEKLATGALAESIKTEFASLLGIKEKYYIRKGRIDPFEPFLRAPEPEVSAESKEGLNRRVPRTPLEKIDMSQLKLTGVLRAENKTRALVQEVSGKGYIVDEGTYIGNKGGQVSKILKDRIMVSEKALDVFGKITVLERELKLQP